MGWLRGPKKKAVLKSNTGEVIERLFLSGMTQDLIRQYERMVVNGTANVTAAKPVPQSKTLDDVINDVVEEVRREL